MTSPTDATKSLSAVRKLLVRGDDPYAGADMPSTRNAVGVLLLLHAVLALAFLALAPPTAYTRMGWVVGGAVVLLSGLAAAWVLRERSRVTFDRLLMLAYVGLAGPVALELLSAMSVPYQLLFLVWVGCGAVHSTVRAVLFLVTLALAAIAPLWLRGLGGVPTEALAWTVLFSAVGLVLNAYVTYVRRQRLELRRGERHALDLASAATQRVRDLQWVTDATLLHLPLDDLLDELMRRIVATMGLDHGMALLCDEDARQLRQAARWGSLGEELERGEPVAGSVPAKVVAERRPVALEEIEPDGALERRLAAAELRSVLAVPLLAGESLLGVLLVAGREPRRFSEDDADFLRLVGDRLALAVERSRLFEGQRHIAETLQHSLLPDGFPTIPDATMAVRYCPGGPGVDVGGDWYDVLDLRDGRVALAIGDVVGRGLRAATLMGRLKTALQAYALEDHEPAAVLERLHRLLEGQAPEAIATVLYLVVDPSEGEILLASAGHLPPLVRTANGEARYLPAAKSPPLGAVPYARYEQHRVSIAREATLVLFTDGLVERPGANLREGLEHLRRAVEEAPAEPEALCDAVLSALLGGTELEGRHLTDDVALLVVGLAPLPAHGFSLDLPAEPEVLATLRAAIDRWLTQTTAHEHDAYAIKAATTEACANAIEHAYRPGDAAVRVEAACSDGTVNVTVRDFGHWREARADGRGRGIALMKHLMDSADVERSEHGTTVRLARRIGEPERS